MQSLEYLRLTGLGVLRFHRLQRLGRNRYSPFLIKQSIGRNLQRRFRPQPALGLRGVERDELAVPAPLLGARKIPLSGEVVLKAPEQERAKAAQFGSRLVNHMPFEQVEQEALDEVLSVFWGSALATDERIEREPVGPAEFLSSASREVGEAPSPAVRTVLQRVVANWAAVRSRDSSSDWLEDIFPGPAS